MTIRVIAAVVDVRQLRLYKEDGSTLDIPQGDPRLSPILEQCKPLSAPGLFGLSTNDSGVPYVEIEIFNQEVPRDTTLADYEANQQKAGRVTRFFRVLKNRIAHLIGNEKEDAAYTPAVEPQTMGNVPTLELADKAPVVPMTKMDEAISDIMAHAEPVSNDTFDPTTTREDQTIVAVTTTPEGRKAIIPGVDILAPYMVHANKTGNSKGLEAFMSRLGAAISKRGHSVNDVLRFMEKGDLPLADDGTIIAYKVLRSTSKVDNSPLGQGIFVDCHSGKVEQRVGSYVCQSIDLICQNKEQCGTGLHIARRAYLGGFGGDIIVMVKIRPEDVIVVPTGEPDKMRACGYHIIGKIPKNEHEKLRSNKAMEGTNALKMLQQAISGDHIGIIERIEITQAMGGSFTRTPVTDQGLTYQPTIKRETPKAQTVAPVKKPEPAKLDAPAIDPKQVAKQVETVKKGEIPVVLTKAQEARKLYVNGKYTELKAFKKAAKKSWEVLGFQPHEIDLILGSKGDSPVTNGQPAVPAPGKMTPDEIAKQEQAVSKITLIVEAISEEEEPTTKAKIDPKTIPSKMEKDFSPKAKDPTPALPAVEPKKEEPKMTGTRAEVARKLFDEAVAGDKTRWGSLWRHQKECKKSWSVLGFNAKEIERIKTNKPDWI